MTQPGSNGRASIEVVGDVHNLGKQLQRDAQQAVDHVDLDTDKLSADITDGFEKGAQDGVEALQDTLPDIQGYYDKLAEIAKDYVDEVDITFDKHGNGIVKTYKKVRDESKRTFDGLGRDADTASDAVGSFARFLTSSFTKVGDLLSKVGSGIADTVGSIASPSSIITIGAQIVAYSALTTVIIGLGAALADLAGFLTVLPSLVGVAAISIGTLVIAFQGFGDAISAVIDGDPEKIAEALKKLAPAARGVVKEFQTLLPQFRALGDLVQQRFFAQLTGDLTTLVNTLLPTLRAGFGDVAESLGNFVSDFAELGSEADTVATINKLFETTALVIDNARGGVQQFFEGILKAADELAPSFADLALTITNGLGSFGEFLSQAAADGSLQAFFDDAVATAGELFDLTMALGDLLGVLFGATDDDGRDFIQTLTDLTQRLTEFFKSAEGQRVLERVGDTLKFIGQVAGFVVNAFNFLAAAGNTVADVFNAVVDFFNRAGNDIGRFWDGLVSTVSGAVDSVGTFFSDLGSDIADIWDGIVETVSGAVDSVVTFVSELPGKIAEFIGSIPGLIADAFNRAIDTAISVLAFGIAAIIVFFTDLPGQVVGALSAFWDLVVSTFEDTKTNIGIAIDGIISFFTGLWDKLVELGPQIVSWAESTWNSFTTMIKNAVQAAIDFVSTLPARFREFFSQAATAVTTKVGEIVAYVKGIPGKIISALGSVGTMLYSAGAKIIQGLIDGINSKIQQLKDKIASAVQSIRDYLPYSPAKVGPLSGAGSPAIAGETIARMIADGLDAGLPLLAGAAGRASGAVADAGVTPLTATPNAGTPVMSPTQTTVSDQNVFIIQIGDEEIEAFIDKRIDKKLDVEVRRLLAGSREL